MKAFVVTGDWHPRPGYDLDPAEVGRRRANCGSQVWRNPLFAMTEMALPDPGDDDLIVRVKSCGICGSDTHLYETDEDGYIIFSGPVKLPCVIGHEYSGIVEGLGRNVTNFQIGDRVAAESIVWCGKCTPCRSGAVNQCDHVELAGITVDGALAEYVRVNARQCWKIDSLAARYSDAELYDVGALLEPLGCAYNGLFVAAGGFRPGVTVVVYGVGPIGLGAVALARVAGAGQILAFDPIDERLQLARTFGADATYNTKELAASGIRPGDLVRQHTNGRGAEIQVEAAGAAQQTIPEMENSLARNGTIVYLGRAATYAPILLNLFVSGANRIVGSRGHSGYGIYDNLIRLLASGRLDVAAMITSRYAFADTAEALARSVARCDAKIMVQMGH